MNVTWVTLLPVSLESSNHLFLAPRDLINLTHVGVKITIREDNYIKKFCCDSQFVPANQAYTFAKAVSP